MNKWNTEDLLGGENNLYSTIMTLMMDTCHYTFFQTQRMYNTKSEW